MRKIISNSLDDLVTVKEVAHILKTSPKTVYNKLSRGEFPLNTVKLPWNRRDIFFLRREVEDLVDACLKPPPTRLVGLLRFIPGLEKRVLVAAVGVQAALLEKLENPLIVFKRIDRAKARGWERKYDLLWIGGKEPVLKPAKAGADNYAVAAVVGGLIAEILREESG